MAGARDLLLVKENDKSGNSGNCTKRGTSWVLETQYLVHENPLIV